MDKIRSIRLLSATLLASSLILSACGSAQQVGQKVEANPVINVNVPGAVAPAPAASNAPASTAPTNVSASVAPTVNASIAPVITVDEDSAITQVIKDNVNALNAANQNAYVNTFDPNSDLFVAAPTMLQASIQFGIKQEVLAVSVSNKSASSATVNLSRRVTDPANGIFMEQVLCGLTKINNSWKISSMSRLSSQLVF